ncbi:MAG: flavin reductase family protein [Pseudomonadota bacterium]
MRFDFADYNAKDCYKLVTGGVIPRPVGWVTTMSPAGVVNAAPYSFFNVFGDKPAIMVLGFQDHADGTPKDTALNIRQSGEFVVNMLTPDLAEKMVETAAAYPPEQGEPEAVGLTLAPSVAVAPPRLAEAPVAYECRRLTALSFSAGRELLVGEAVAMEARDGLVEPETLRFDWEGVFPLARLFGPRYAVLEEIEPLPIPEPRPKPGAAPEAAE